MIYRGQRPTMPHIMELHKLPSKYKDMKRIPTVNRCMGFQLRTCRS